MVVNRVLKDRKFIKVLTLNYTGRGDMSAEKGGKRWRGDSTLIF
jgi:hypothetical protein